MGFGLATTVWGRAFGCCFGWWRRERRQTGQGEQKFVRGIEQVQVSVDRTIRGCEEDGGAPRVVDGDIGRESSAAARFFDDVRRRVDWQDVNPSETDASRFTGMVKPLLTEELGRKNVEILSGGVL